MTEVKEKEKMSLKTACVLKKKIRGASHFTRFSFSCLNKKNINNVLKFVFRTNL